MTLVENLLELLRPHFPGLDAEVEAWARRRPGRAFHTARPQPAPEAAAEAQTEEPRAGRRTAHRRRWRVGGWSHRERPGGRENPGGRGRTAEQAPRVAVDAELAACYAELGLPYGAGLEEARRAWKRLLSEHHPDRCAGDAERALAATERVKRFNRACDELTRRLSRRGAFAR